MDKGIKKTTFWAIVLVYLLIALEIIIMVSPFAGYFYSVYGPFLNLLSASPLTSWMTDFFLPHMTFPDDLFLMAMGYVGPLLFYLGLFIFLAAAIPLYYSKFRRKGVVKGGLYSIVRHPQYTGFAIAGLGILIYWPRFFILIMYITMLYLYYLLARNEEWRMEGMFGDSYREYKSSIPMFIPGGPGEKLYKIIFGKERSSFYPYLLTLIVSIGIAFVLRGYTKMNIPFVEVLSVKAISVFPMERGKMEGLVGLALNDQEVAYILRNIRDLRGKKLSAIYMMPADYGMMGLISDVKKKHIMEEGHRHRHGGIGRYVGLLTHHLYLVGGRGVSDPPVMRLFFVEATYRGEIVDDPLGVGVKRLPLFYVDIDTEESKVVDYEETPPVHRWGDMPMPAF